VLDLEKIFKNIRLEEYLDLSREVTLLLLENDEIQTYDIEEACYISQTTVNNIIRQVRESMQKSGLRLEKSGPACRTIGSEFDKRRFLMQLLFPKDCDMMEEQSKKNSYFQPLTFVEINGMVDGTLAAMGLELDDVYLRHVVVSTAVSFQRYVNGHMETEKHEDIAINEDNAAYCFDKELISQIYNKSGIRFPDEEFLSLFRFHMGAFREKAIRRSRNA